MPHSSWDAFHERALRIYQDFLAEGPRRDADAYVDPDPASTIGPSNPTADAVTQRARELGEFAGLEQRAGTPPRVLLSTQSGSALRQSSRSPYPGFPHELSIDPVLRVASLTQLSSGSCPYQSRFRSGSGRPSSR